MREDLARRFFVAGLYREAVEEAEASLDLIPNQPKVYYILGAVALAEGEVGQAEGLFQNGARLGRDPAGAEVLQALVKKGIAAEEARRFLKVFFGEE